MYKFFDIKDMKHTNASGPAFEDALVWVGAEPKDTGSATTPAASKIFEMRTWTAVNGKTIDAKLVKDKGRKTRIIPLWNETVVLINHYLEIRRCEDIESDHLFLNKNKVPITRFGIGKMINRFLIRLFIDCPNVMLTFRVTS